MEQIVPMEVELEVDEIYQTGGSGVIYQFGDGIKYEPSTAKIAVDTVQEVQEGDTRPVSSDAVFRFVGDLPEGMTEERVREIAATDAALADDLTATKTVGGISQGRQYPQGTGLETIFRELLNPTEAPVFTAPSATIEAPGAKLLEKGGNAKIVTMTVTFNRGTIIPAYGTSGNRAGEATGYSLNGGATQVQNRFNVTVTEANSTFSARVDYAEGEQPKNSIGEDYAEPLPAGSVTTNTLTYEFVDPLWSNTANIRTVAKEQLVSKSARTKTFSFPSQTEDYPEVFDVPASWNVTGVQVLNELNNKWEDCSAEFDVTDEVHGDTAYKRYTDNRGYGAGPRQIKITWS